MADGLRTFTATTATGTAILLNMPDGVVGTVCGGTPADGLGTTTTTAAMMEATHTRGYPAWQYTHGASDIPTAYPIDTSAAHIDMNCMDSDS